jgi:hypothetical protein
MGLVFSRADFCPLGAKTVRMKPESKTGTQLEPEVDNTLLMRQIGKRCK